MKRLVWMSTGILALAVSAGHLKAQTPPPAEEKIAARPAQCPAPCLPSADPAKPVDPNAPPSPSNAAPAQDNLPSEGGYKETMGINGAVAGIGLSASANTAASATAATTAAGGANTFLATQTISTTTRTSATSLIMPGLFTAASIQSVVPIDRVAFDYGYFDKFRITGPNGTVPGFNLNQFNFGAEKTILDGLASIYVSVPLLEATANMSGQQINGLGDVNVGFKVALLGSVESGNLLSAGMTVAAPTAHRAVISATSQQTVTSTAITNGVVTSTNTVTQFSPTVTTTVDPTFLQPWVGGLLVRDAFFVSEYLGIVIPTDDRVSTFINNNVAVGYDLLKDNPRGMLTSLTPILGAQLLIPVTHAGTPGGGGTSTTTTTTNTSTTAAFPLPPPPAAPTLPSSFGFPDQLFLSGALQFGLGERTLISAGLVSPVVGPRAFNIGASFGINFFY